MLLRELAAHEGLHDAREVLDRGSFPDAEEERLLETEERGGSFGVDVVYEETRGHTRRHHVHALADRGMMLEELLALVVGPRVQPRTAPRQQAQTPVETAPHGQGDPVVGDEREGIREGADARDGGARQDAAQEMDDVESTAARPEGEVAQARGDLPLGQGGQQPFHAAPERGALRGAG
ncbi:MAG: hypothetical protein O2816_09155 [Planctomycetota bacterium]|nr:hypothetical protein [Planctomycetota bacterium]